MKSDLWKYLKYHQVQVWANFLMITKSLLYLHLTLKIIIENSLMKFLVLSTEIIKCTLLSIRNNDFVYKTINCKFLLFVFLSFSREKLNLLAGQISAFRVSWIARFRLSLINALTSARVWNGDPVKGAVECSRVNFYGDLKTDQCGSPVLLFFSWFYLSFFLNTRIELTMDCE